MSLRPSDGAPHCALSFTPSHAREPKKRSPVVRSLLLGAAILIGELVGLGAGSALAQSVPGTAVPPSPLAGVIERNPAPAPAPPAPAPPPPIAANSDADATPLGPTLNAIVLVDGPTSTPLDETKREKGVDVSRVRGGARLSNALGAFIGRPLSRRVIAEVEAAIAQTYRDAGRPFVHITTPEQNVTSGRLIVNVSEFRFGTFAVEGADPASSQAIAGAIRQKSGEPIDARLMAEDLDWLNRYPFRRVTAEFAPANTAGLSDATYQVTATKPWAVGGGYSNSGSPQTGMDRAFLYALSAIPFTRDAWASYQLTTSDPKLIDIGAPSSGARRYVSHAGRVWVPVWRRTSVEFTYADIASVAPVQAFDVRQHTRAYGVSARTALSNLSTTLAGEVYVGFDWKQQRSRVRFGRIDVLASAFDVGAADLGYAWKGFDSGGESELDFAVHVSPGGLSGADGDTAYASASQGAFHSSRYAYLTGSLNRRQRLGWANLVGALNWQYADVALPQTEKLGLGGPGAVRAYTLDDGAFDRGAVLRTELRFAPRGLTLGALTGSAEPYAYLDAGVAQTLRGLRTTGRSSLTRSAGAAGVGVELRLTQAWTLSADAGVALHKAGETRSGDTRANIRLTASF